MSVRQFAGYAKWWLLAKAGKKNPLVNTMIINFACNLRCKHCTIHSQDIPGETRLSYDFIVKEMQDRFDSGSRIMYFEGGEPTMWKDGDKDLGDLIRAGREIGYNNIGYTTNGTNVFFTDSDVISISLDGPKEIHDAIRGEGVYDKLMKNLDELRFDGAVFANMVIQRDNIDAIEETAKVVRDSESIDGIMFNFLTPPPYEIALKEEEKKKAVELMSRLKAEGYPIMNSKKGLKLLADEDWSEKCPRYLTVFTVPGGHRFEGCPMTGTDSCKHCGFAAAREYYLVDKGDPKTIIEMSSIFAMSK
ncbi:MAG: radical SAM protein [Candidatus Methanoplasma sp.]|jgi:MoaA/NifB/PqqE/SkfB family radical SAM enzyme|nr:radical SAM protein [Candidatus Methanoplasma sp.]